MKRGKTAGYNRFLVTPRHNKFIFFANAGGQPGVIPVETSLRMLIRWQTSPIRGMINGRAGR